MMIDNQDCCTCIHSALCEDFPTCPFFEQDDDSQCKNWQIDLSKP